MRNDLYGTSPYDSPSFNDQDLHAGPSRPPPITYDDPYSESYGLPDSSSAGGSSSILGTTDDSDSASVYQLDRPRGRGRGGGGARDSFVRDRGRGRGRDRTRDRGRGRGRGRGGGGGGGGGGDRDSWGSNSLQRDTGGSEVRSLQSARALSPTSAAIARATGQYSGNAPYPAQNQGINTPTPSNNWGYQQYSTHGDYSYEYPQAYIQPHINPRFASQFGMNISYAQPMRYAGYAQYGMSYTGGGQMTSSDWVNSGHDQHSANHPGASEDTQES